MLNVRSAPLAPMLAALMAAPALAQVSVTTQHNDLARTGANLAETRLTTSNVGVETFGKLFARAVDDQIYAQPLVVSGVDVPGVGPRNVVYVATMSDSVYAFDADDPAAAAPYWVVHYTDPANGILPVNRADVGQRCGTYADFSGNIGIVGTPVIDQAAGTIYFVARTKENGAFVQRLRALDIRTGAERPNSPVVIQASVPGTGAGSSGGVVAFNPQTQNQRPALALANGKVYVAWASHCDTAPYHGWVIAYDATTLAQSAVFNTSPNGRQAGVWQSGQAPAFDEAGNLYFSTGNGSFDGTSGPPTGFGETVLKLSPSLALLDWFTPFNVASLNTGDTDLGSAGVLVIPDTNLAFNGGKEGKMYLLDRGAMGHWQSASDSQILQSFQATSPNNHIHSSPIYWRSPAGEQFVYLWPESEAGRAYKLTNGTFQTTPAQQTTVVAPQGMPGAMLSISANGSVPGTAILWANHQFSGNANQQVRPGILRAFDAANLSHELWNSKMNAARDDLGDFAKFSAPTIANGKVYLATFSNQLVVYGLLSAGGGSDTPGLYVPSAGSWFLRNSNSAGPADAQFGYGAGGQGPKAVSGDWDGNGTDTPGLYDPATGWFFLRNANAPGPADVAFSFGPGGAGWQPVVGDWDGDGDDTVGLYAPSTGFFFLRNANAGGAADVVFGYGPAGQGWVPLAGDWDGDGDDTVGLFEPVTGFMYLRNANAAGPADVVFGFGPAGSGWAALAGDWDGDGDDTPGLYDPQSGFFFLRNANAGGPADLVFGYGPAGAGWVPLAGDWDGL